MVQKQEKQLSVLCYTFSPIFPSLQTGLWGVHKQSWVLDYLSFMLLQSVSYCCRRQMCPMGPLTLDFFFVITGKVFWASFKNLRELQQEKAEGGKLHCHNLTELPAVPGEAWVTLDLKYPPPSQKSFGINCTRKITKKQSKLPAEDKSFCFGLTNLNNVLIIAVIVGGMVAGRAESHWEKLQGAAKWMKSNRVLWNGHFSAAAEAETKISWRWGQHSFTNANKNSLCIMWHLPAMHQKN